MTSSSGSSHNNPPPGPSGRSPFPTSRSQRTRLTRPSFGDGSVMDESHSPFLLGLLRFSPSAAATTTNTSTTTTFWSPPALNNNNNSLQQPPPPQRSTSFFGGSSHAGPNNNNNNNNNNAHDNNNDNNNDTKNHDMSYSQPPAPPPAGAGGSGMVMDGIPLDPLRSLAQQSLFEHVPSTAIFFCSLLYTKTQLPADALLLAQAHLLNSSAGSSSSGGSSTALYPTSGGATASLRILEASGLLQSDAPWQGLLLACAALSAQEEWPSLVQLLEDACRLPLGTGRAGDFGTLAGTTRPLNDDDEFGWDKLQQVIGQAQQQQQMPGSSPTTITTSIHWLARICAWRGRAHHETGHAARAKLYWKRALQVDARCQQAWESLLDRHLLTAVEAFDLLQQLQFDIPSNHPSYDSDDTTNHANANAHDNNYDWLKAVYMARIELAPQQPQRKKTQQQQPAQQDISFGGVHLDASAIPLTSPLGTFQTPASAGLGLVAPDPATTTTSNHHHGSTNNMAQMQKQVDASFDKLWNEYKLHNSPHVLAMAARRAHSRYDWKAALYHCELLAQQDPNLTGAAYIYLSTLVILGHKRALFRIAHDWVDASSRSAQAWFAVGAYYYTCQRYHVAQRHFCRATRLEPSCTAAWIAFGCAFCACDESDQALASFRAAQRLAPADHTSLLYMGMEYVRTNHLVLAHYFLNSALAASGGGGDALCLHELGVLYALKGDPGTAIYWLERALITACHRVGSHSSTADDDDDDDNNDDWDDQNQDALVQDCLNWLQDPYWEPILYNLGHCYRRTRRFDQARACFGRTIALCPQKASTYAALAFTKHLQHDLNGAIANYHEALSIKADDPFASDMLQRALLEQSLLPLEENEYDAAAAQQHAFHNSNNNNPVWNKLTMSTTRARQKPAPVGTRAPVLAIASVGRGDWNEADTSAMSMDVDMSDSRTTP